MPAQESSSSSVSSIESELYFLIARFLSSGPCSRASEVLLGELKEHKLLPKRIDWEGREHYRSYPDLIEVYRHISSQHLLNICQRLGPLLDKEVPPSISGVPSLLGAGSLSLLRTVETSKKTTWSPSQLAVLHHSEPLQPPRNIANITSCHLTKGREMSGRCRTDLLCAYQQYSHVSLHDRKLGHLSAVYCVSFDRTGQYIVTGADDHLVKIWSAASGRLLATMRGHSAEITDLAINYENTLLAAGSCDKIVRVWCLRTKAPVAVLHGHTGMITSVQFCPQVKGETRYLGTTGADGCVCFWQWNVSTLKFNLKPIKFVERSRAGAQMLCSSFSPGGLFLATGNSDNVIRVYFFHATCPEKICELEAHKDRVDSITYSNLGMRFVSGSKDGTARIWRYERQEWKALVLNMATKLQEKAANPSDPASSEEKKDKLRVTMVAWTVEDEQVITAVSDYSLKVWDSHTGKLVQVLQSHQDEVFVLEGSPINSRILLSAGHDGNVIIWDIKTGTKIKSFFNMIEGQGHGAVFDCKFSPDGLSFSAVDSHGHLLMFGFGSNEKFQKVPKEVFFHTDYRPLVRDANNYVLDEQTQQAPHLMPPPFLVDIDGNPYPPPLQRLVPGREKCKDMMLIPEVAVNEEGSSEVIGEGEVAEQAMEGEPAPIERMRPSLDAMIVRLQREQDNRIALEGGEPLASPPPVGSPPPFVSPRSSRNNQGRIGMRRSGETEGVRQSLGNVSLRATKSDIAALKRRVVVRPLDIEVLWRGEERRMAFAEEELKKFVFERKKKPNSPHGTSHSNASKSKGKKAPPANAATVDNEETARNRLITRALYDTEDEEEEEEGNSSGSDFMHDSDSDEYSDWMGDTGSNLQPPKRTSQRQRKRKRLTSSEDDNDDQDEDDDVDIEGDNDSKDPDSGSNGEERRSKRNKPPPKKKKKQTKERSPKLPTEPAELLEMFRPPEWLTDTIPRKAPFVPQMGDEVMYFRQGHEAYLNAVKRHKVYEINTSNNQPWHKMPNLREQELVKIVGIKYEIRPPRLCCLKLAFIDHENGKMTGGSFSIKYHDMPDVIDFLVLRQTYNTAMRRKWKPDDRFRAMIDDHWWMGTIVSQEPFQAEFTDSMYQCFNVHWDNEEFEKLSPWDLEPITDDTVPNDIGGGIQVEKEELKSLLYTPTSSEWPPGGRDEECSRLVHGLEILMEHSMAEPFNAPVDLNLFPDYARVIEYPVDLSTIKARLENHFYRRVTAVQFDVRHIATNTSKFNEPNSAIVQKAVIVTDTLLKFISEVEETDLIPMLTELMETEKLENNVSDSSDSTDDTSRAGKRKKTERGKSGKRVCREKPVDPDMWKRTCHELVMRILECEDSEPFRTPVDPEVYQDYYNIVETPMDLSQVKEKLESQLYSTPLDLVRDVRLIFSNSKSYNTNKRSRIYAMTLRLSAMFDDQIRDIITEWKSASKRPSLPKLSTRSSTKGSCAATSTTSRERTTALTSDNSTPSTSSSQGRLRVTRSKGGATDHGSADGYSSGPSVPSRPRRSATTTRYTGGKVMGSDGESAEEDDSDTEDLEMDQETEQVLVEKEEEDEETEKEEEEEEEVNRRRSKRKPPPRPVAKSEDEEEDEDDDDGDDDDDDTEDESGKKIRTRGKMIPKRNSRSTGKISNGHSKPSYRTRASTGKTKQTKYVNYESSSMVSKSNSSSSASPGQTTGSGDNGSSSSGNSSSESGEEAEEDKDQHSDYAEPRSSRRASTKQQSPRSIQKQVEIVRHSARERRKVQDNMFVYEQQRKSRIKTRNQGRRTVQYQEDESDNEKGARRSEGRSARQNDIVENNSDSDSESASDSNSNETRSSTDTLTMSSRGRVRKLTPRARASLFGD